MGLRKKKIQSPTRRKLKVQPEIVKKPEKIRIESLDLARGFAIVLMILSHGIVGLVPFDSLSGLPLVPVHLVTKFSSTLFFLVFGIALGLFFVPQAMNPEYHKKRNHLLFKALEILVWYKTLTFIQMFQIYDRQTILNTLMYLGFPDFAEVLGFYGIFLLWFPFVMPRWSRLNSLAQMGVVIGLGGIGYYLTHNWDFGGYANIKAILVEEKGYYTFGQAQRGAVVLFGTIIGQFIYSSSPQTREKIPYGFMGLSLSLFIGFIYLNYGQLYQSFVSIASNGGKHPPELNFSIFSSAGAFLILGLSLLFKDKVHKALKPFVWIGQHSLQAFVFHIFIIFVGYRYLLDFRHKIDYGSALWLTVLLIFLTFIWCYALGLKAKK